MKTENLEMNHSAASVKPATYSKPQLTVFGSVATYTNAGSVAKSENGGHPDGRP